jgi:ABC-type branched-subunit amino acid transport system substrate-binding protein
MVTDLGRLSKALSDDTPEKLAERAISQNADKIARALETNGVYEDAKLGLRISANNGRAGQ